VPPQEAALPAQTGQAAAPAAAPPAPPAAAEPTGWQDLLDRALSQVVESKGREKLMPAVERVLILKALERTAGNQVQAARLLGISRNTLRNRIGKYGIRVEPGAAGRR
jgi:sigma-54-specific transcriptional regulator